MHDSPTFLRLQTLFDQAVELDGAARESFLDEAKQQWPALVEQVRELLRADADLGDAKTVRPQLPVSADGQIPPGQRLGPFVLRELLGRGGMGAVYLGERGDVEQQVAIKVLGGAWMEEESRRRFRIESQVLARLEHPAIARLIDVGESANGAPYLAMEYIPGATISQYCDRTRASLDARLRLFRQVCEAVAFAHRNLVVHRDLKPENVLVRDDGQVKLVDFGIAKPLTESLGRVEIEKTGTTGRVFSPSYAAPEQISGDATTLGTDVYGLGVVLYQLLCGALPFDTHEKTPREVEDTVLHAEPVPPSRNVEDDSTAKARGLATSKGLRRRLRGDLDSIVLKCLRKSPHDRYLTVADLTADLDRFLDGRPVVAREGRLPYRVGKLMRRHWIPLATAAAIVLAILGGLAVFYQQSVENQRQRDRARFVTEFVVSAFESADPTQSLGAEVTAAQILDQSLRQLAAEEPNNPDAVAELLLAIARVQASLGRGKDARQTLSRATAQFETSTRDRDLAVRLLLTRSTLALDNGETDTARELAQQGLSTPRATLAQELRFELLLARCSHQESNFEDARGRLESLLPRLSELGSEDASLEFDIRNALGTALYALGRIPEALAVHEAVLAEQRQTLPAQHPDILESIHHVADLYMMQERVEDYGRAAAEIRERTRSLYGPESLAMASAFNSQGTAQHLAGNTPRAIEHYEKAIEIYRLHYGDRHQAVARRAFNIALAASEDPTFHTQADSNFQLAIGIGSEVWPEHHRNLHLFRTFYALFLNQQGRFAEALEQAGAALADAEARPEYKDYDVWALAKLADAVGRLASRRSAEAKADVEEWLEACSTFPPERLDPVLTQARIAMPWGIELPAALEVAMNP